MLSALFSKLSGESVANVGRSGEHHAKKRWRSEDLSDPPISRMRLHETPGGGNGDGRGVAHGNGHGRKRSRSRGGVDGSSRVGGQASGSVHPGPAPKKGSARSHTHGAVAQEGVQVAPPLARVVVGVEPGWKSSRGHHDPPSGVGMDGNGKGDALWINATDGAASWEPLPRRSGRRRRDAV